MPPGVAIETAADGGTTLRLVARTADGEEVGSLDIGPGDDPGTAIISAVAVVPRHRRTGVATAMLAAAEQLLRTRGVGRLELGVEDANDGARQLYLGLGYVPVGHADFSYDRLDAGGVPVLRPNPVTVLGKILG